jgi:hypothetical protein
MHKSPSSLPRNCPTFWDVTKTKVHLNENSKIVTYKLRVQHTSLKVGKKVFKTYQYEI